MSQNFSRAGVRPSRGLRGYRYSINEVPYRYMDSRQHLLFPLKNFWLVRDSSQVKGGAGKISDAKSVIERQKFLFFLLGVVY